MEPDPTSAAVSAVPGIQLTQHVKSGGCASKLAPGTLQEVLRRLPRQNSDSLLVGFETADDAGVYVLRPDLALVQTVDFFTPMVDDPFTFGRIAATNALSDVYAMGGLPLTALAMVCFPQSGSPEVLEAILRGGLSVMEQAGCVVLGGHSVRDEEIKFGYAVTGTIHPGGALRNSGAVPGDALVLTKALGTGVITTALKARTAHPSWVEAAVTSMTLSNARASQLAAEPRFSAHAMTDITGFGLMGHGREMAVGSGVRLRVEPGRVQVLEGALEAISGGSIPGGLLANRAFAECIVKDAEDLQLSDERRTLLYDPQTAGGLLIALPASHAGTLVDELQASGYPSSARIGTVEAGEAGILLAGR